MPAGTDVSKLRLPDPARKTADTAAAAPLQLQKKFLPENWRVTNGKSGPVPGTGLSSGLQSASGRAVLGYAHPLPDGICLDMKFRHSGKFKILADGIGIGFNYHPAGGWFVENADKNDNLDRCDVSLVPHGRSYSAAGKTVPLKILFLNGRVSVWYDGVRIVENLLPAKKYSSHLLSFETRDGNWIGFEIERFGAAECSRLPVPLHPIR